MQTRRKSLNNKKEFGRPQFGQYDPSIRCIDNFLRNRLIMSVSLAPERAAAGAVTDDPRPVIKSAADVSRLVNSGAAIGSDARVVVAIALGGIFLDAYDLGALAFGMKDIAREFSLTPTGSGFVAAAITFGAIIGAFLGGYLTDKVGRYRVFMADMFFFVVAAIACALAPNA